MRILCISVFLFFVLPAPQVTASEWQQVADDSSIGDIVFGNGIFLASTQEGTHQLSQDGIHWEGFEPAVDLKRMEFGNGRFVGISSDSRQLYSSQDGIEWSAASLPKENLELMTILYGDGRFVLRTTDGYFSSPDLESWFELEKPPGRDLFYAGDGRWVVRGKSGWDGENETVNFHSTRDWQAWDTSCVRQKKEGRVLWESLREVAGANGNVAFLVNQLIGSGQDWAFRVTVHGGEDFHRWGYHIALRSAGDRFSLLSGVHEAELWSLGPGEEWRLEMDDLVWEYDGPRLFTFGHNRFVFVRDNEVWLSPPQKLLGFAEWLAQEGVAEEDWEDWEEQEDALAAPLFRFAAGWPLKGSPPERPRPRVAIRDSGEIAFTGTVRDNSEGVKIIAEESEDLLEWRPIEERPEFVEWVGENVKKVAWNSGGTTQDMGKKFFRLRAVELIPDLIVTDVQVYERQRVVDTPHDEPLPAPDEIVAGEEHVFYATIQNVGNTTTPAGIIHGVSFWVNEDAVNWSDHGEEPLAPGESRHLRANGGPDGVASWTPAEDGQHEIMAWVDDIDRMEESDDSNNKYWRDVQVIPTED